FFYSSRRRHTRCLSDWSSDVCSSDLYFTGLPVAINPPVVGSVEETSEEYKLGIREGDLVAQVDGKLAKSWQDVQVLAALARTNRSEERRVGKEGRGRGSGAPVQEKES